MVLEPEENSKRIRSFCCVSATATYDALEADHNQGHGTL